MTTLEKALDLGKGMSGKGGARNFAKPYVDSGILYKALAAHDDILSDMRAYEHLSRTNAPCPKGLLQTMPLWKAFLKLEPSGEMHSQPLRVALISLLAEKPALNKSQDSGQVWASLRVERITCLLNHVRQLSRAESLTVCASKLTRDEFSSLQQGLQMVKPLEKETALEKAGSGKAALEKAGPGKAALEKEQALVPIETKRKLKAENSNTSAVSMDSTGFPKMFGSSPEAPKKAAEAAYSSLPLATRRAGSRVPQEPEALEKAMGYVKALKRPAAALKKAKKKGKAKAAKAKKPNVKPLEKGVRKPGLKIRQTFPKNPLRSYLTGTTEEGGKLRLIVEVTAKQSPQYLKVIGEIKEALEKDDLTKEEAVEMKAKLLEKYDA